jgi:curved DNA-binding protein
MTQKDYYKILGVERISTSREIKDAYRNLAFEFHPDRNKGDINAVEKMKELNEAYAVLSNPEKRKRYDSLNQQYGYDAYDRFRQGYSEEDIFRGSDINQIFEEMTRQFGFRNFDELFKEFYGPGYRTFEFSRPGVFGRGFIFTGFHSRGEGDQKLPPPTGLFSGLLGKLAGYLVRKVFVGREMGQTRDRYDVITLDREDARRGARVSYIDRDTSRQLIVTVPAGLREGQTIRLKGGVKNNTYGTVTGDLYLKLQFRQSLLDKARTLYNKLTA